MTASLQWYGFWFRYDFGLRTMYPPKPFKGSSMAPIPSITSGEVILFSTVAILNQSKPYLIGVLKSIATTNVRKSALGEASSATMFLFVQFSVRKQDTGTVLNQ